MTVRHKLPGEVISEEIARLRAEADHYREALEKIVRLNPVRPFGDKIAACRLCERGWFSDEPPAHKDTCPLAIARAALPQEDTL